MGASGLAWSLGFRLGCGSLGSGEEEGSRLKLFFWNFFVFLDYLRCG